MKFKVGDWVKYKGEDFKSRNFKDVKQIKKIHDDMYAEIRPAFWYTEEELELVCGFEKGELVEVWNNDENCTRKCVFHEYIPELKFPFVVLHDFDLIGSFAYAKKFRKTESVNLESSCLLEEEMKYELGKKYIVSDWKQDLEDEDFCNCKTNQKFLVGYVPGSKMPFICVCSEYEEDYKKGQKFYTSSWEFCKEIKNAYRPYSSLNANLLGMTIKSKVRDDVYYKITELLLNDKIRIQRISDEFNPINYLSFQITLQELFDDYYNCYNEILGERE